MGSGRANGVGPLFATFDWVGEGLRRPDDTGQFLGQLFLVHRLEAFRGHYLARLPFVVGCADAQPGCQAQGGGPQFLKF